jgi:hypothetical protein
MVEYYKNHADDPDTKGKVVLDPFMGGGTTVVEALRLGCMPIGIDLNPVAWFIVKTEIEPVDVAGLKFFADLWQALIALSDAGESVLPLLERFRAQWPEISAGLKYCRQVRSDWAPAIDRVIAIMEVAPLLRKLGAN